MSGQDGKETNEDGLMQVQVRTIHSYSRITKGYFGLTVGFCDRGAQAVNKGNQHSAQRK